MFHGFCRNFAFASWVKKDRVSSDHFPPTLPANTTKRARPRGPMSSRFVRFFRRRAASNIAPSLFAAPDCGDPSQCKLDTSVVQGQLPPPEHREPVNDHLQTSHVERILANEDVCGDTRSTLSTHAGSSTVRAFPDSRPGASCTVVAMGVEWAATRKSKVRKKGGSMRVRTEVGLVESAAPAPQPPCNLRHCPT